MTHQVKKWNYYCNQSIFFHVFLALNFFTDFDGLRHFGIPNVGGQVVFNCDILIGVEMELKMLMCYISTEWRVYATAYSGRIFKIRHQKLVLNYTHHSK